MEPFLAILLILFIVAAARVLDTVREEKKSRAIKQLASQNGGAVLPGVAGLLGMTRAPTVAWSLAGGYLIIGYETTGSGRSQVQVTVARFRCPYRVGRVEIYPQTPLHVIAKLFGMEDLEIGVPVFDDAFILKADQPPFLRSLLTHDLCRDLLAFKDQPAGELYIHALGVDALVQKQGWLVEGRDLARFRQVAASFFPRLVETARSSGCVSMAMPMARLPGLVAPTLAPQDRIQFVGANEPETAGDCLVCGQGLNRSQLVRCLACDTPHHPDCWDYNGSCAVYGCGGRQRR